MSDMKQKGTRQLAIRHRGRGSQVIIYFGKLLRMFVYQNDWKVLPMAALIAGLVGMVLRIACFVTMEATLMGSFALVCVAIWNGCFNSIQVICRERDVIKREHRSGMHISSYILSHMLYQALLCLAQTAVTMIVTQIVGVQYPSQGLITNSFLVDIGISIFLISYASDMLSLWISALAHNTTTAMTIMPFVLIFQLVFSGGMIPLPAWTEPLTHFTISNPALKLIATQADTNHRPYATIATLVDRMRDNEIGGTFTVGQVLDVLQDENNPAIAELRTRQLGEKFTLGQLQTALENSATFASFQQEHILEDFTIADLIRVILESNELQNLRSFSLFDPEVTVESVLRSALESEDLKPILDTKLVQMTTVGDVLTAVDAKGVLEQYSGMEIDGTFTIGQAVDLIASNPDVTAMRDREITVTATLGKLMDLVGQDKVKTFLEDRAAAANYKPEYELTEENIVGYWSSLILFIFIFALLSTVTLEFIDKDKR